MAKNKPNGSDNRRPENVLIARFSALGDVAMTIPVVYSACRTYPAIKFIMVTRPSMTGIFINRPDNLQVIGTDVKNDYSGACGIRRLVHELHKQYDIDAFIDLHDVLRTKMMRLWLRLKGVRVIKLNKGRGHKRALTRRRNKVMLPLISSRARYREAFFRIGLPIQENFDGLYGRRGKGPAEAFADISGPKPDGWKWAGIAPFAAHKGKIYPIGKMEEVLAELTSRENVKIFLFGGGGDEADILNGWAAKYPNVVSLAGKKYGFNTELSLMSHLDVVIAMDSANMHLASIVGTKVVSVWGATHPYCGFKGWRQSDTDTVQLAMTCRPCSVFGNKPCHRGDYHCLNGIRPGMIAEKALQYLQ